MKHGSRISGPISFLTAFSLAAPAVPASAHGPDDTMTPVAHCWKDGPSILCRVGHAGGWPEAHAAVGLFSQTGRLLWSGKADARGQVRFRQPEGPFHILLGDKRGETVEVDWRDIAVTRLKGR